MTKPKRWYIENGEKGLILIGSDGECIKKPNARHSLGNVIDAQVPCDKKQEDHQNRGNSCKLHVDSQNYARNV